jgi:hypothetical protein
MGGPIEPESQVARLAIAIRRDKRPMSALPEPHSAKPATHLRSIPHRFVLAWAVMIVGLVGFWCCRPFLGTRVSMGFAVEKLWDCPIAATTLGDFWGRRWNRIVPGFLREVVFLPVARRAGAKVALVAVFLYSGIYHEGVSFMARSGYGGPTLYFLLQCLGVAIENSRPVRRLFRGHLWIARAWTFAVIVLPVGLFLHPGLVHGYLVPMLVGSGVPGLER